MPKENPVLYAYILAVNFLKVKPMLDVCWKTLANRIKEFKTVEEVRKRFNIKNDLTPEQEAQIIKENAW